MKNLAHKKFLKQVRLTIICHVFCLHRLRPFRRLRYIQPDPAAFRRVALINSLRMCASTKVTLASTAADAGREGMLKINMSSAVTRFLKESQKFEENQPGYKETELEVVNSQKAAPS